MQVLLAIVLLHGLIFWALQSGLFGQIRKQLPKELFVTLLAPELPASRPKAVIAVKAHKIPDTVKPLIVPVTESPVSIALPVEAPVAKPVPEPVVVAPAETQAPLAPPLLKTIASGVEYLRAPQPLYPPVSRRMREQGKALVRVLVNESGVPEKAEIQQSSGSARLDEAARQAVLNALFKPSLEDGRPMPVYALVPIRFQLDG